MKRYVSALNATVGRRLYVLIGLAMGWLIVMAALGIFVANTLDVTTLMARLERYHTVAFHAANTHLESYLSGNRPSAFIGFQRHMNKAVTYSDYFGRMSRRVHQVSTAELADELLETYDEIRDHGQALVTARRIKLLYWHPLMARMIETAQAGGGVGREVIEVASALDDMPAGDRGRFGPRRHAGR